MNRLGLNECAVCGGSAEMDEVIGSIRSFIGRIALVLGVLALAATLSGSALV